MLAKRVIPCLDINAGRVVKGVKFEDLRDAGDPVEVARRYDLQGADELVFLDITASSDERPTLLKTVEAVAEAIYIPLTVGGGVRTCADVRALLQAGADKVSINTAAVVRPDFVSEAGERFGVQCIVVAIDAKRVSRKREAPRWEIFTHGGRKTTGLDAVEWAAFMVSKGAGELLVTSMDRDGTKAGYDLELLQAISASVPVPVIASGGVGTLEHLAQGFNLGGADAVLAASIFHSGTYTVGEAKQYLAGHGVHVRLPELPGIRDLIPMDAPQQPGDVLDALYATLLARRGADPAQSYVASLYAKGPDAILKKIAEEAGETVIAAKNAEAAGAGIQQRAELVHEVADLWFHTLVLLAAYDLPVTALTDELARRSGRSGHDEKASRSAAGKA